MASGNGLEVTINTGRHPWKPPKGMDKVFHGLLLACGLQGSLQISLGEKIRGSAKAKKVEVHNFNKDTKSILFYCQPGAKDTRHECTMIIPGEHREAPEEFVNMLYRETGDGRYVAPEIPQQAEKQAYEFTKNKEDVVIEKTRRESASKILADETMLVLILEHIAQIIGEADFVENGKVLEEIRKTETGCWERGVLEYLLKSGYLSEERISPKKSKISMTAKSRELLAKGESPSQNQARGDEEDLFSRLEGLGEELEQFEFLREKISALEEDIEHVTLRLEEMRSELERFQEELALLGDIPAKRERIFKALKLDKLRA